MNGTPRILLLSTRPRLNAKRMRAWCERLGAAPEHVAVVAMPEHELPDRVPVRETVLVPRRRFGRRIEHWVGRMRRREPEPAVLFARGCERNAHVGHLFETADLVIAVDLDACWAAWRLAQRFPRPQVVRGISAGIAVVRDAPAPQGGAARE